jgi:hypothetical protein
MEENYNVRIYKKNIACCVATINSLLPDYEALVKIYFSSAFKEYPEVVQKAITQQKEALKEKLVKENQEIKRYQGYIELHSEK